MKRRPTDIQQQRSRFDELAEATSRFVSEAAFFIIATLLVAIWIPTIFLFDSVDTWQLVLNTVTSVLAFLLIALLQNSERRYDQALHAKVDTLAEALAILLRQHVDEEGGELDRVLADLDAARALEERI